MRCGERKEKAKERGKREKGRNKEKRYVNPPFTPLLSLSFPFSSKSTHRMCALVHTHTHTHTHTHIAHCGRDEKT